MSPSAIHHQPLFVLRPTPGPPKQPTSHRALHIQNVLALFHLSLLRADYPRARRAWRILAGLKEVGWESLWLLSGALTRDLEGGADERAELLEGLMRGGGKEVGPLVLFTGSLRSSLPVCRLLTSLPSVRSSPPSLHPGTPRPRSPTNDQGPRPPRALPPRSTLFDEPRPPRACGDVCTRDQRGEPRCWRCVAGGRARFAHGQTGSLNQPSVTFL